MAVINTNLFSLNAQKNLLRSQNDLATSMQRLSSGLRINSAKDDAAGLAISERMTAQIRGMNMAIKNANDGISLGQTAESNLVEVTNALQRIRELAVQSANGTYSTSDRTSYEKEVDQLQAEVDRIMKTGNFNGKVLFDQGHSTFATAVAFQVGAENGANYKVTADMGVSGGTGGLLQANAIQSAINAVTVTTVAGAQSAITKIDTALDLINDTRATFGAIQNRFESVISNLNNVVEATEASRSRIRDADFAAETANLTRAQILQQAGTAMLAQANVQPQSVLSLLS